MVPLPRRRDGVGAGMVWAVTEPAAIRCARAIACCTGDVEKESGFVQLSQDMVRRVSPDAGMVWPSVWESVVVRARG